MVLLEKTCTAADFSGGYAGRSAVFGPAVRMQNVPAGYRFSAADPMGYGAAKTAAVGGEVSAADRLPLTMGYLPRQVWCDTYDTGTALCRGSLFPELDKPFLGCRGEGV